MAGLILLAVLAGWAFFVYHGVRFATRTVGNQRKQKILRIIFVPIVFLLPVADEVFTQAKFHSLCLANTDLYSQLDNMKNKTIIYQGRISNFIDLYPLPIVESEYVYLESETNNVALKWKSYEVKKGGWLSRAVGIFEGNPPISFNGQCGPKDTFSIKFKQLNILVKDKNQGVRHHDP